MGIERAILYTYMEANNLRRVRRQKQFPRREKERIPPTTVPKFLGLQFQKHKDELPGHQEEAQTTKP